MFSKELQKLGMGKGEALVYSTLLRYGECSATQIAKYANLGRTNVYDYAASLAKQGLVSELERNKKTYYKAGSPALLQQLAEQKLLEAKQFSANIELMLPRLESAYHAVNNFSAAEFFSGNSGKNELCDRLFLKTETKQIIQLVPDLGDYSPPAPKHRAALQRRGVYSYLFTNMAADITEFNLRDEKENRKTVLVPIETMPITAEVLLIADLVVIGDLQKDKQFSATLIHNHDLARQLSALSLNLLR